MKSTMFSLNTRDLIRGGLMAILVPVFVIIQQSLTAWTLVFDWKAIAIAAIGGLLAYITKNFFTNDIPAAQKTLTEARQKEIKEANKIT